MSHPRTTIRQAIVSQIIAANTSLTTNVFPSRFRPLSAAELPLALIYVRGETSDLLGVSNNQLKRILKIQIDAHVTADLNIEDAMDSVAQEIENAINNDWTFGGLAITAVLVATDLDASPDGETQTGNIRLTFDVTYIA